MKSTIKRGFTLSELLIALSVLGVIATFTIPKILDSGSNAQRNAILKEAHAALELASYEGYTLGQVNENIAYASVINYFMGKLNNVKQCPNDMVAEGCWPAGLDFAGTLYTEEDDPGMTLHNGAVINFWPGYTNASFGNTVLPINIDWNGPDLSLIHI